MRPLGVAHRGGLTQLVPQLFGYMRGKGGYQHHHRLQHFATYTTHVGELVGAYHEGGDAGVEREALYVIGNLLDNAVEAVSKRKDDKYISLSMKFQKGSLLITLKNSFDGILKMKNDRYLTTKNDPKQHGIGLQSIETVIRKYNGEMIARHSDSEFVTKIIMIV